MPEKKIVINTGPILALVAACGDLKLLDQLYATVYVPQEVAQEIIANGENRFAVAEFAAATWLHKWPTKMQPGNFLRNSLDSGEAAVIQLALQEQIELVCIDEAVGRRVARLNGLKLTGSVGILLRGKREGLLSSVEIPLQRMKSHGIWLSDNLFKLALREAGEL